MSTSTRPHDRSLRRDRFGQTLPDPLPNVVGRQLTCTLCDAVVDVLEAAQGATTLGEHRHLDPANYACGECLDTPSCQEEQAA